MRVSAIFGQILHFMTHISILTKNFPFENWSPESIPYKGFSYELTKTILNQANYSTKACFMEHSIEIFEKTRIKKSKGQ